MRLNLEDSHANIGKSTSVSNEELELLGVKPKMLDGASVDATTREIRRRTMWSCFILDRYLSFGRNRPQMDTEPLNIQLPCSEPDFQFYRDGRAEFHYRNMDDDGTIKGKYTQVGSSSILSIYIRLVGIWGRLSKWSSAGGRRSIFASLKSNLANKTKRLEKDIPPWDEHTQFFTLRKQLDDFQGSLSPDLTFSQENLAAHAQGTSITAYTAIHTLFSLCNIVLHREYIPFIPLRCDSPIGPLDEPTFSRKGYDTPKDFWEESAKEIFKAAKDIMEIVSASSKYWICIESPFVAFAIWTAAYFGVYSINFSWMDTCGYMNGKESSIEFGDGGGTVKGATNLAIKTLTKMSSRLKMASVWSKRIERMDAYFARIIQDYNRNSSLLSKKYHLKPLSGERALSLREGGSGGGLELYKVVENELKDFGSIEEEERHSTPAASDMIESRASTSGPIITWDITAETIPAVDRLPAGRPALEGTWAAVNNNASTSIGDLGCVSYSFNGAPHQLTNTAQDTTHYHQQQQPRISGLISNSLSLMDLVDLNSSYSQSELVHVPQQESYSYSPQPILSGYPTSAQHTFRLHQTGEPQDWAFNGQLSGVPAWEWPLDGDTNFYDTSMLSAMQEGA